MKLKLSIICALLFSMNTIMADEVVTVHLTSSATPSKIAVDDVIRITFNSSSFNILTNKADVATYFKYSDVDKITFDDANSIDDIYTTSSSVVVAPNPAKENLIINGADKMYGSNIYIYSVAGTLVSEHRNWNGEVINVSHLNAGIYFVNINSTTVKFVKQ